MAINKQKKMKEYRLRERMLFIGILLIIIVTAVLFFSGMKSSMFFSSEKGGSRGGQFEQVQVTKENLPLYLESLDPINDLPDDASIQLQLYHFEGDTRVWEETYAITQGNVAESEAIDPDIVIILHSNYLKDLGNFCSTIQTANKNGDLGIELNKNEALLLWKYKGILKHKSCLGL